MRANRYSLAVGLTLLSLAVPNPTRATSADYFLRLESGPGESSGPRQSDGILSLTFGSGGGVILADLNLTGSDASGPYSIISSQGPDTAVSPSLYTVTLSDGHLKYHSIRAADFNHIDSEVAAIRSSLELCAVEGLEELAYREAKAVKTMGVDEPYRIAVERL